MVKEDDNNRTPYFLMFGNKMPIRYFKPILFSSAFGLFIMLVILMADNFFKTNFFKSPMAILLIIVGAVFIFVTEVKKI